MLPPIIAVHISFSYNATKSSSSAADADRTNHLFIFSSLKIEPMRPNRSPADLIRLTEYHDIVITADSIVNFFAV